VRQSYLSSFYLSFAGLVPELQAQFYALCYACCPDWMTPRYQAPARVNDRALRPKPKFLWFNRRNGLLWCFAKAKSLVGRKLLHAIRVVKLYHIHVSDLFIGRLKGLLGAALRHIEANKIDVSARKCFSWVRYQCHAEDLDSTIVQVILSDKFLRAHDDACRTIRYRTALE
jgi:hypothetical protein